MAKQGRTSAKSLLAWGRHVGHAWFWKCVDACSVIAMEGRFPRELHVLSQNAAEHMARIVQAHDSQTARQELSYLQAMTVSNKQCRAGAAARKSSTTGDLWFLVPSCPGAGHSTTSLLTALCSCFEFGSAPLACARRCFVSSCRSCPYPQT